MRRSRSSTTWPGRGSPTPPRSTRFANSIGAAPRTRSARCGTCTSTIASLEQEEERRLRRHLLQVEKDRVIELFRQGVLSQDAYERVTADVDTRLLDLESAGREVDADDPSRSEA